MKDQVKKAASVLFGLLVAAAFIAMIGVPNPSLGKRQAQENAEENPQDLNETGWWSQNNKGGNSWW